MDLHEKLLYDAGPVKKEPPKFNTDDERKAYIQKLMESIQEDLNHNEILEAQSMERAISNDTHDINKL